MKKKLYLLEDVVKVFMTKTERELKKKLIQNLIDDGKGHKHAKYAARLAKYDLQIVPLKGPRGDPEFTAGISFDDGIIYIGEGFVKDPGTFFQLNVLMRHELAHNLLMHQIRMMNKIGKLPFSHISSSQTLHGLLNIIEDFEISNKKYSDEDKKIVRNMWLNGKIIGGLVTEDHRQNWQQMSVEEMYDNLTLEIEKINTELRTKGLNQSTDLLSNNILGTYIYTDTVTPAPTKFDIENLIKPQVQKAMKLAPVFRELIKALYESIVADQTVGFDENTIMKYMELIADSSPIQVVDIVSPTGEILAQLYTPEEKLLAMYIFKNMIGLTQDPPGGGGGGDEPGDEPGDDSGDKPGDEPGDRGEGVTAEQPGNGGETGGGGGADEGQKKDWYDKVKDLIGTGQYTEEEIKQIIQELEEDN